MIRQILLYSEEKLVSVKAEDLDKAIKSKDPLWLDIEKPEKADMDLLERKFTIHPLAVEDCLHVTRRPKVEEYPNHLSIVVFSLVYQEHLQINQLNILVGRNFLITIHRKPIPSIDTTIELLQREPAIFEKGIDHLLYRVIDSLVDHYFLTVDKLDEAVDTLEHIVFTNPDRAAIESMFELKKDIIQLRRTIGPERDIINLFAHREYPFVASENMIYFRDVFDHIIRITDTIENLRDLMTSMLDVYLSTLSLRMNEVIKVLTVIATIMFPLTLIAGIYGMNFQFIPEIHTEWGQKYGYFFAIGLMAFIALIMLFYFKRKKWI